MTQCGEASFKPSDAEESKQQISKEKLKIRFSLFFDGTLNNATNIAEREKAEMGIASEPYKKRGDGGSNSYDNGRTNIAIMESDVPITKGKKGYDYSFKVYIEGQGTFNLEGDSLLGYSMGALGSGVSSRANKGFRKALEMLKEFLKKYPPDEFEIEKIDVDVFGFSRGAATARHSIFLMTDGLYSEEMRIPLYQRLVWAGYEEMTAKSVEIKFAGLYDTVVSVNASQYNPWSDNKLNQRAVALASKSVHLAAAEEHRQDFPLHTIKSAKDNGKGEEYYLPGVHSDVGGSYNQANLALLEKQKEEPATVKIVLEAGTYNKMNMRRGELIKSGSFTAEQLIVEVTSKSGRARRPSKGKLIELRTLDTREYMRSSSEIDLVVNDGYSDQLNTDRDWLVAQGWYKPDELSINITGVGAYGYAFLGDLVANRKNIKSAYSNIPLKIMAKFARENEIEINPKLEDNANIILNNEPDLLKLEKEIEDYVASKGNGSKPEDWIENKRLKEIRHNHLHMSAKMNMGYFPRFKKGVRRRYYYDG